LISVRDGEISKEDLPVFAAVDRFEEHFRHLQDAWACDLILLLHHPLVGQQEVGLLDLQRLKGPQRTPQDYALR
tara:strand:- start:1369 stop:1590 length:222 start_codon:yes stop_codon:yes gene_type:complete